MKLVLVRHGQSEWNKSNQFTGWYDAGLTGTGLAEAKQAGKLIQEEGLEFDMVYTSVLKRAILTMVEILKETDRLWLPVTRAWQLNERHYGGLTGLNKKETAEKHGAEQVHIWRRSYATPPPPIEENSPYNPKGDLRYAQVDPELIPTSESLKDTYDRVMPYWNQEIVPQLKAEKRLLIVAHGNSLRALFKHLMDVGEDEITKVDIPTGRPMVVNLNAELKGKEFRYLGDQESLEKAMAEVANQGKK